MNTSSFNVFHNTRNKNIFAIAYGIYFDFLTHKVLIYKDCEEATFESTKSPKSLSGAPGLMGVELPADRETLAFEGGVEEAVRGFPKNINVAAATASAADAPNVRVRLVARPGLTVNTHHIDVKAGEMHCELFFHSAYDPKNPRSSTSTAWSVLALLKNLESPISYFRRDSKTRPPPCAAALPGRSALDGAQMEAVFCPGACAASIHGLEWRVEQVDI